MVDVLLISSKMPLSVTTFPFLPLGVGYLSACLEREGIEVKILDLNVEGFKKESLHKRIVNLDPKIVGISSTSLALPVTVEIANFIKTNLNVPIFIGGPHVSGDPTFLLKFRRIFDYEIIGEGEIVFPQVVKKVLKNRKPRERIIMGKPVKDLNSLPLPAFHLLPMKEYKKFGITIMASRGCPYSCIFCPLGNSQIRFRKTKNVIEELRVLNEKYNVDKVNFEDNNFNVHEKYTRSLCTEMLKEKLDMKWSIQTRCDLVNSSTFKLIKKAGCEFVSLGIETFSERLLKEIKKNLTLSSILTGIKILKKIGLKVGINCMFGFPTEKSEDVRKSVHFVRKLKPDYLFTSLAIPFPGTELFNIAVQNGMDKDIWNKYALGKNSPPVCLSKNFNPLLYLFYFIKLMYFSSNSSLSRWLVTSNIIKLFPKTLSFIEKRQNLAPWLENFYRYLHSRRIIQYG